MVHSPFTSLDFPFHVLGSAGPVPAECPRHLMQLQAVEQRFTTNFLIALHRHTFLSTCRTAALAIPFDIIARIAA